MKPKYIICLILSVISMFLLFIAGYKISYNSTTHEETTPESTVKAHTGIDTAVNGKTEFTLEKYYLDDYSLTEEKVAVPNSYIGYTREELLDDIKEYMESPSIEDIKKGIVSFELISFTDSKLVLRKTYKTPEVVYEYYLKSENNYVTVYYIDKKTVYDYTSICVDDLPKAVKNEVEKGKYIETIVDLYDFLETYSS